MQTEESTKITRRFFEALYELKNRRIIRGKQTFTDRYGINRWNLNALESGKSSQINVQLDWLTYLVRDYGISARWLLTGEGEMFARTAPKSKQQKGNGPDSPKP